ncbi:hypothetical protein GQ457_07G045510 [Hibiscus cannabinus]
MQLTSKDNVEELNETAHYKRHGGSGDDVSEPYRFVRSDGKNGRTVSDHHGNRGDDNFEMEREPMALPATWSLSVSCHTPPGGLTPAWKVTEAMRVATTNMMFRTSPGLSTPSSYWKRLYQLLPVLKRCIILIRLPSTTSIKSVSDKEARKN